MGRQFLKETALTAVRDGSLNLPGREEMRFVQECDNHTGYGCTWGPTGSRNTIIPLPPVIPLCNLSTTKSLVPNLFPSGVFFLFGCYPKSWKRKILVAAALLKTISTISRIVTWTKYLFKIGSEVMRKSRFHRSVLKVKENYTNIIIVWD